MKIPFTKYHGTGNDFVMIDNTSGVFNALSIDQVQAICSRRFGVGADGLIMIELRDGMDFYMNYYNADGTQSFCGNGSRCAVAYAKTLGIGGTNPVFNAIDGPHIASVEGDYVRVKMGDVGGYETIGSDLFINTGSPHYIKYVEDLIAVDIIPEAHKIRYNERFAAKGTNVNFLEMEGGKLSIRTYERGVEGETLSCGTGVTAAALSYAILYDEPSPIQVLALGGALTVHFERSGGGFSEIWLAGPTQRVFEGEVEV